MTGLVEKSIVNKLTDGFQPEHLQVINESHSHNVPEHSETHFKVFLVSEAFSGKSRIVRQRQVYELLAEEMQGPVHALSLRLLTPEEWVTSGQKGAPESPPCHGGSQQS